MSDDEPEFTWRKGLRHGWWRRINWVLIPIGLITLAFWGLLIGVLAAWFFDWKTMP